MADDEKKPVADDSGEAEEAKEEQADKAEKKSGPSPLTLAVIGIVAFAIFLGVFSFTMGVFDKKSGEEQTEEQIDEQSSDSTVYEAPSGLAADEPDIEDEGIEFNFAADEPDTMAEISWIEVEKKKIKADQLALAVERRQLETVRQEVETLLAKRKQIEGERLAYLAKLFDGMKQEEVSKLMAQLDDETIVTVLPRMKTSSASRVLAMLPPVRAARITTMLLGLDGT